MTEPPGIEPPAHQAVAGYAMTFSQFVAAYADQVKTISFHAMATGGTLSDMVDRHDSARRLIRRVPGLYRRALCPACDVVAAELWRIVAHLNDSHLWPREEIADWLDMLDPDLYDLTVHPKESTREH